MKFKISISNKGLIIPTFNDIEDLKKEERHVYDDLLAQKDEIANFHENRLWEKYKKLTNEYELIFTTCFNMPSICRRTPTSRSYFKHWEILRDYEDIMKIDSMSKMKCLFMAEGPGGFVQSFCDYRKDLVLNDELYGITYKNDADPTVPKWKLPENIIKGKYFKILEGVDGTGSLYTINNIKDFISKIGSHSCDYITADGGFDFSGNFNHQERASTRLIMAETYTALQLLKSKGIFVIKIYDIFTRESKSILHILDTSFEYVSVVKPCTSRPANSEKYVICIGFRKAKSQHLNYLKNGILEEVSKPIISYSSSFEKKIIDVNISYMQQQKNYINMTLMYIDKKSENMDLLKQQYNKALSWCDFYGMPISVKNKEFYMKKFSHHPRIF